MKQVTLLISEVEALQRLYYGCHTPECYDKLKDILGRAEALKQPSPHPSETVDRRPLRDRIKVEND